MLRKAVLLMLMMAILLPLMVHPSTQAETLYETCMRLYKDKFDVPPGYPYCSSNGYPFQQKLWDDLGVIVYGNPELLPFNQGSNNFKAGYADPDKEEDYPNGGGPHAPLHPYFTKNGVKGEYRYLGYDRFGQPYVNPYFIPDMRVRKGSDRTWVYRPWSNSLLNGVSNRPTGISPMLADSFENLDQIYNDDRVDEVNSLIKSQAVQVKYSTFANDPNKNLFDYMYVTQDPTVWAPGSGTMWSRDNTGKIWYASYVVDKLRMKYNTPVQAAIEPGPGVEPNYKMEKQLNDMFQLPYKVSGQLLDDAYYNDRYDKAKYYTRNDVESWSLTVKAKHPGKPEMTVGTFTGKDVVIDHGRAYAYANAKIPINKADYPEGGTMVITVTAQVTFGDGEKRSNVATYHQGFEVTPVPQQPDNPGGGDPEEPGNPGGGEPPVDPEPFYCEPIIGDHAIDILPFTDISETTNMSRVKSVFATVNGELVSYDDLISGRYVFGDDADGFNYVYIEYSLGLNAKCGKGKWVFVHDSTPKAEFDLDGGTWKENRTIIARNTSSAAVDPYVEARYPIVSHQWSFAALDGSTGERKVGTNTDLYKELMYTKPGRYQISLITTNALGRVSEPYTVQFSVIEDVPPAIIQHAYINEVARGDKVTFYNHVVSIDGDQIVNEKHQIYYDERGDESYSKLIETINGPLTEYTPTQGLGKYKVVTTAEEVFGQPALTQHLTADSKRSSRSETFFKVENYIPYADIYADIPYEQADVEIYFMLDKNLEQSKIDYVNNNLVTINNLFRQESIDPVVKKWDMKTYTYQKSVSTSRNTGSSYPSSTYSYDQEGYSGTLNLYSVSNNPYTTYHTRTETVTEERTYNEFLCAEMWPGPPWDFWDGVCGGGIVMWYKTVTETITTTIEVPYTVTHDDYTGYYSGTVYRHVREPYRVPWVSSTTPKYIVYISDNTISELPDFTSVKSKSDAKVILVGKSAIRNQTSYDKYIANSGQPIESIIQSVVDEIAALNPPRASMTVLVNQTFQMHTIDTDPESDPIIQPQTQYVHDPNHFDNPQGRSSYAHASYNVNQYQPQTLRTSFDKPGLYTVYRRTKDNPPGKPQYSYFSNEAFMTIAVHRKPIAQAVLDWSYNPTSGLYETTWVDQSYDLDHQYSDDQRGIRERKIRFRRNGGEWLYFIPATLEAGSYELEYTVRDIEGAWSDPFRLNFTLADVPPPQLDAKARTQLSKFTLNNVPASEQLRLYEIWTRYPYSHSLEVAIYNSAGTTRMTPASTVAYYTGTKSGHDIRWNDIVYTIPATLADGNYILRISAIGQNGIRTNKDFPIRVNTPINLVPSLESSLLTRESTDIRASTSKYANNVTVTMFRGSSYQNNQVLTGTQSGDLKNWSKVYAVPAIPDGNYQVRYVATTPNGNSQTVDLTVEVFNNRPPVSGFNWTPATLWEGDAVQIRHAVDDPDNDTLQVRYQVTAPSGHVTHYPSSTGWYNVAPANYSSLAFQLANVLPGQYTIQQTVSDGIAPAVTATKTFIVGELTINGQVKHTEDWDKHRKSYNQKQTGTDDSPRTYDTFWAGEAFILEANTTDTQDSSTVAQWVKVTLLETGDSVYLSSHDGIHWTGELMKEEHIYLPDGNYRFRFEVLYSGPSNTGVTKSDIRTIRISDDVYDFFRLHRIH